MKRCVLCGLAADFAVKSSSEYYCRECGEMEFGSLNVLVPISAGSNKAKQ